MTARTVLAILAALLCGGCVTTGGGSTANMLKPVATLINGPGTEDRILADLKPGPYEPSLLALGEERDLAQSEGRDLGFVRLGELEVYLAQIRERLVAASGISDVPGTVRILATPGPDAKSTPDGNIFISMAWLNFLESEDEIAAILAHELAHVLLRHHTLDLLSHTQRRVETMHQMGVAARMMVEKQSMVTKADIGAIRNIQLATELAERTLLPAWNRRQETEADLLAVDLLHVAGYSPVAVVDMLAKLDAWQANTRESDEAFEARVAELARSDLGTAVKTALGKAWENLGNGHPATDKRLDDAAAYFERHYEAVTLIEPVRTPWLQFVRRPAVRDVLSSYDQAFSASKLLAKGQAREAQVMARNAARKLPDHAYPNWIASKACMALTQSQEALQYLQRAMKATTPTADMYRDMISLNESSGKHVEALKWIETAEQRFGDTPYWLPERIRIYRKMGRKSDMNATVLKCSLEHPQLKRDCIEAAEGTT